MTTLRKVLAKKSASNQSEGNTPMPGWGTALGWWNMPRMRLAAFTGGGFTAMPLARVAVTMAAAVLRCARSRTKNPLLGRASTQPCATNQS